MSKFWFLVRYTLEKRIKTKAFLIANIIIFILTIAISNMPTIIKVFDGDKNNTDEIIVYDDTSLHAYNYLERIVKQDNIAIYQNYFQVTKTDKYFDEEEAKRLQNSYTAVMRLTYVNNNLIVNLYTNGLSITTETLLQTVLQQVKQEIWSIENPNEADIVEDFLTPIQYQKILPNEEDTYKELENTILLGICSFLTFIVFFMIIFLMQYIGMDILDEKSSRSIEIIISNIEPVKHFGSKIISSLFFLIIQSALILFYGFIGLMVMSLFMNSGLQVTDLSNELGTSLNVPGEIIYNIIVKIPKMLFTVGIFLFFGLGLFLILTSVFSAMATSMEDYQQFQMPVILLIVASFYVTFFSTLTGIGNFIKFLGYIPIFSPMLAPALFISEAYTIWNVIISLIILILTMCGVLYVGIPLYKVSILSYSQESFFKRIKKIIRNARHVD